MTEPNQPESFAERAKAEAEKAKLKLAAHGAFNEVKQDIEAGKVAKDKIAIEQTLEYIRSRSNIPQDKWDMVKDEYRIDLERLLLNQTAEGRQLNQFSQKENEPGVKRVTASEESMKKFATSIQAKYPWLAPMIAPVLATQMDAIKKEGKQSLFMAFFAGIFEKVAGWFGHETPKAKFEKFKNEVKLPSGFAFGDSTETEVAINKADGVKVATLKYNAENGRATLEITGQQPLSYKDAADLNKNINDKLKTAPAVAQAPTPGATPAPAGAPTVTPAPGAAPAETPTPAPAPAPAQAAPEQPQETPEAKYTRLFKAKGWELDTTNLAQDLQALRDGGIPDNRIEEEINKAAARGSNLNKFYEAIRSVLPTGTVFELRLTDLLCKNIQNNIVNKGVAVIKSKRNKTTEEIRKFVDESYAAKDNLLALKRIADAYKA